MTKRIAILIFCLSLFPHLSAQQKNSLLWEISGNGLNQKSYIFGTMHMIKKSDFFITQIMKEKLMQSQCFITEIDMNISLLKQLEISKQMFLPDGKTLKDFVSDTDFANFKSFVLDSLNIKEAKFEKYIRLKPFFLSAILTQQAVGKIKAYEKELYKIAKNNGIPSDGLESFEFQFSLVDATPIQEQAKDLIQEISTYKQSKQLLAQMVAYYKQQDLAALYNLIVKDADANSEFNENFIFSRNKKWIPLIIEKIKLRSCFIAVGAAHLPGELGILQLLKQQGYTVTPLN
ncbi:MAG: TraB/GumN family protein [Bacteroidota bacterium]